MHSLFLYIRQQCLWPGPSCNRQQLHVAEPSRHDHRRRFETSAGTQAQGTSPPGPAADPEHPQPPALLFSGTPCGYCSVQGPCTGGAGDSRSSPRTLALLFLSPQWESTDGQRTQHRGLPDPEAAVGVSCLCLLTCVSDETPESCYQTG